ncbi:MAG: hypothetical protein EP318_02585 [Rhodobacteraceae bacterium]|nr:MAG: hypothetical protein EP318_02585 [Paracoccaceae bacterium]
MTERFNPVILPADLRRESILQAKFRPEGYLEALDRETLWYDAFWSEGRVTVIGPPLNNLRGAFRQAEVRLDGRPVKLWRMRRYKRHFVAQFLAETAPERIAVTLQGWTGEGAVARAAPELFDGLNSALYVNKNNDLEWLKDHAAWHKQEHGLQALAVVDNMSTAYRAEEIAAALAPVGLARIEVLRAPFKYGPMGLKPYRRTEKYMQTALFNVMRLRFFGAARAVLSCDVDELILRRGARGVFDAAQASRIGFVQVPGFWVHAAAGSEGPWRHGDHLYAHQPPRPSPPKFCVVPSGPLGGCSWDIHGFERLPFLRSRVHKDFVFMHCRGVSTAWKSSGRLTMPRDTVINDEVAAAMARMPQR